MMRRERSAMAVADSHKGQGGALSAMAAPPRRARRRLLRWASLAAILVALVAFAAGFLWFVAEVPTKEVALGRNADGIVVLTGGASRIIDGVELLAAGRGKRLLISGAHRATSVGEIARLIPEYGQLIGCCVDLDHSLNTTGNAVETKRWVEERGFRSLIVVTSSYHMPRTMAELARRMPGVALVPFPVVTDKMKSEAWWASASTAKLLFSEYLKYILAEVRMRLHAAPG
jgi:uncharacterized SAM-binding protein YcdF (DUF218 family)